MLGFSSFVIIVFKSGFPFLIWRASIAIKIVVCIGLIKMCLPLIYLVVRYFHFVEAEIFSTTLRQYFSTQQDEEKWTTHYLHQSRTPLSKNWPFDGSLRHTTITSYCKRTKTNAQFYLTKYIVFNQSKTPLSKNWPFEGWLRHTAKGEGNFEQWLYLHRYRTQQRERAKVFCNLNKGLSPLHKGKDKYKDKDTDPCV